MKKILLTGVNGQVGRAIQQLSSSYPDWQIIPCDRHLLDLTQPDQIRQVVQATAPDLIINPAAYTAVDQAESEPALAHAINAVAPGVLAEEAARCNAALIHFSTDYVYDGSKHGLYEETDAVNPLSVYGASKLAGENAIRQVGLPHLILRTSWVYGGAGKNFMKTILRLAQTHETLRIVADQHGAPTSDHAIAHALAEIIGQWQPAQVTQSSVYHLVNHGETSWHGFASEIVAQYRHLQEARAWPPLMVKSIEPIPAAAYPTPAKRPANSRLSTRKLQEELGVTLPTWQASLHQIMAALHMHA